MELLVSLVMHLGNFEMRKTLIIHGTWTKSFKIIKSAISTRYWRCREHLHQLEHILIEIQVTWTSPSTFCVATEMLSLGTSENLIILKNRLDPC